MYFVVVIHLRLTSLSCSIAVDVADKITITACVAVGIADSIFAGGPAWNMYLQGDLPGACCTPPQRVGRRSRTRDVRLRTARLDIGGNHTSPGSAK